MHRNLKLEVLVVIAVLLLPLAISCLHNSYATAQTSKNSASNQIYSSTQVNYGNLGLKEHKMTSNELKAYESSVGVYQGGKNYNQIVDGHGTGLTPPTPSEWNDIAKNGYVVDEVLYTESIPNAVDLSQTAWFPPIGDQGTQGSCSFFANVYYAKSYQEAKEHQWNLSQATWVYDGSNNYEYSPGHYDNGHVSAPYQSEIMSPAFVYNLVNNGSDIGGSLEGPIMVMCSIGVSSWLNMPYNQSECNAWPSEAAWAQAPYYRSNSTYSYQYIYVNETNGITNLKNWLAAGNVATFAIDAYDNIVPIPDDNSQDLFTLDNWQFGGLDHAQTIVGYNDSISYIENGTLHSGAFKVVNSWGIGEGPNSWENVPDGCYWVSYQVMAELSAKNDPVVLSQDLIGYQPQILATFNISHTSRQDCNITFGLGSPNAPLVTKTFDEFNQDGDIFLGGSLPFSSNNIVFDLTEFKDYTNSLYNQLFFMKVYDAGPDKWGTNDTGIINYFAVGNNISTQTPVHTIKDDHVTLTVKYSMAQPTVNVSPTSGPPAGIITLTGNGFTGHSVNISYLNPINLDWTQVINNLAIATENFTYTLTAPDLIQNNQVGDNQPSINNIFFKITDNHNGNSYNSTDPYMEWRRGLTQIGNQTATGLYGNCTNLTTDVFVENGQSIVIAGKWFSPGIASLLWNGNVSLGTTTVEANGNFNATITVPTTTAGQHSIVVNDGASNFCVNITRLPTVTNDYNYVNSWHTSNVEINLTSDLAGTQIYYSVNNGSICNVTTNGQPIITTESTNNTLEYWVTWDAYGTGNMELNHLMLMDLKLEKTPPQGSMQINNGQATTTSNSVTLSLTATSLSEVTQMRFSNNNVWDQIPWQNYTPSQKWQVTSGEGLKTVYCQIKDNAGLVTNLASAITLTTSQPTATATPSPTQTASPLPSPTLPTPSANTNQLELIDYLFPINVIVAIVIVLLILLFSRASKNR